MTKFFFGTPRPQSSQNLRTDKYYNETRPMYVMAGQGNTIVPLALDHSIVFPEHQRCIIGKRCNSRLFPHATKMYYLNTCESVRDPITLQNT